MNATKLLIIVFTLFTFLHSAFAFSGVIHQYAAVLAVPDSNCEDRLRSGAVAPSDTSQWGSNIDFVSDNWKCPGGTTDCPAQMMGQKYYQRATQTYDTCDRAYNVGVASFFFLEAMSPTERNNVSEGCKSTFDATVGNRIISFDTNFSVTQSCTLDDNSTITLTYGYNDWNYSIERLKTDLFIDVSQIQQQETTRVDENIAEQAAQITAIIKQQINEKPTPEEIEVTTKTLLALNKYTCFEQSTKKNELYLSWKKLDPTAQGCLDYFLNGQPTNSFSFGLECPNFGGNVANSYVVQSVLDSYFQNGFADRDCQRYSFPTTVLNSGQLQQQQFGYNFCTYTPKHLLGCVQEFENTKKIEDDNANNAETSAAIVFVVLIIIAVGIIKLRAESG